MENLEYWVKRVTEEFYELVYADEWLKHVFTVDQKVITSQQVDFMVGALGGEKRYGGKSPADAHPHIFITEEMWERRESLLNDAMTRVGAPLELRSRWFKIDLAFKKHIVMKDESECKKRFFSDELIVVSNPGKKVA
jgi:hemoglobin